MKGALSVEYRLIRRHLPATLAGAVIALRDIAAHAKPACRGAGHPSEGKGNTCCPGLIDDGHRCQHPTPGEIVAPGILVVSVPGSGTFEARCKTGDTLVGCCIDAVKKGCRRKQATPHAKRNCRRRGKKRCRRNFA